VAIQENNGTERLVLGGGGDVFLNGEMAEKGFWFSHLFGMALVMEQDKATNPFEVGLLGAIGIMLDAKGITDLLKQFFGFGEILHYGS
jgi:hypothetical protein